MRLDYKPGRHTMDAYDVVLDGETYDVDPETEVREADAAEAEYLAQARMWAAEVEAEMLIDQYDNDPNVYAGTYSED